MAEIVNSLFGTSPESLLAERNRRDYLDTVAIARQSAAPGTMMSPSLAPFYQEAAQTGQLIGKGVGAIAGLFGVEDPEMRKLRDVAEMRKDFDLNTPTGIRDYAKALNRKGYGDFAMAASLVADEKEKASLGIQAAQQRVDAEKTKQALDDAYKKELQALGPNPTEAQLVAVAAKYASPDALMRAQQDALNRKAMMAAKQAEKGLVLTPGQKAADISFAKDYTDFVNGGGISTIQKNLKQLDDAINKIETAQKAGKSLSGKSVGLADSSGTLSYLFPDAAEVKDLVGGVAQSNLRQVLGGQFAQKEGEALLARAYNPAQPVKDNLQRLKDLRDQINTAANAKIQSVAYYEQNGTLVGFRPGAFGASAAAITGNTPSAEDPLGFRNKPQGRK